jgi:hypothetical protein
LQHQLLKSQQKLRTRNKQEINEQDKLQRTEYDKIKDPAALVMNQGSQALKIGQLRTLGEAALSKAQPRQQCFDF